MGWFLLALAVVLIAYSQRVPLEQAAVGAVRLLGFDPGRLSNAQPDEPDRILAVATRYGIDPRFLAAVRLQENGGPGREFGILSVPAPDYELQIVAAAQTIRNTLDRYRANIGAEPVSPDGRYTDDFVSYFAYGGPGYPGYAPVGASNDPQALNQYWLGNVMAFYQGIDTQTV